MVRTMLGLYRPQSGDIRVMGEQPAQFSRHARERIGYMPQQFVLYPNLTVSENLRFVSSLYGMGYLKRRRRLEEVLRFTELYEARGRLGGQLSGGMQRRLELACALVHNPRLFFADEPTAGIDPVLRGKFWDYFRMLRDQGHTLFVTTQYVGEAAYCDYVGVMRGGRLLMVEAPQALRRRALGGDVIRIGVDPPVVYQAAHLLQRHPLARRVRLSRDEPGVVLIYVEDSSEALPVLLRAFDEHPAIEIRHAEEYHPPFDDIFVRLMEQADQREQVYA